jgi:hypothetical protein
MCVPPKPVILLLVSLSKRQHINQKSFESTNPRSFSSPFLAHPLRIYLSCPTIHLIHSVPFMLGESGVAIAVFMNSPWKPTRPSSSASPVHRDVPSLIFPGVGIISLESSLRKRSSHLLAEGTETMIRVPVNFSTCPSNSAGSSGTFHQFCQKSGLMGLLCPFCTKISGPFPVTMSPNPPKKPRCPLRPLGPSFGQMNRRLLSANSTIS